MGKNIINAKINIILKALVVIFAVFLIVYDFLDINLGKDKVTSQMLDMVITRFAGGICFLLIIYLSGYKILNPVKKPFLKSLIIILPCLAVAINNLPAIALLRGIAYLDTSAEKIIIFAIQCFCIGFFEETAFRGVIFPLILEKTDKDKKGVFKAVVFSSALFGFVHLFNLFSGAGFGAVILQIGYSFLLGGMWSVILLKTGNIWLPAALHAIYDFCGLLLPTLGGGDWWDVPTIIITVIIALINVYYILNMLKNIKAENVYRILNKSE